MEEKKVLSKETEELVNTRFAEINRLIANEIGCKVSELEGVLYVRNPKTETGFSAQVYAH